MNNRVPSSQLIFQQVEASAGSPTSFNYLHITFLSFQAVIEVVIVCLAGFWAANSGLLNNNATKIISRLNVDLFTPALIFTKLASSLSLRKLLEVIIIPILYAVTTLVSYISATYISSLLGLTEPESNFVTAMAVFGNSNSLPVSLTLALAYTLPGLEWDDIENDNADKIASRGLVYLLIFQQLGQMLRWSWGFNTLLKRQPHDVIYAENCDIEDNPEPNAAFSTQSASSPETERLLQPNSSFDSDTEPRSSSIDSNKSNNLPQVHSYGSSNGADDENTISDPTDVDSDVGSVDSEPSVMVLSSEMLPNTRKDDGEPIRAIRTVSRNARGDLVVQIQDIESKGEQDDGEETHPCTNALEESRNGENSGFEAHFKKFCQGVMNWMNPPLWSMILAIIVASIGPIRYQFYEADGFIQNTLAKAIKELGSVSIPLILVVLGANLAPSSEIPPACKHYSRMIFGSLISRMVLPSIVLLPLIVLCVKYVNISIMDDPIFTITSFLLITSPPAIQLSQICQLNEIYQKEMAGVLFYGYVILTLPVTIFIVVTALQCVAWAQS
ncbi:DEBR0S6_00386g1_1 [Brettanomyces bruxellensis]|uniref:DEBR0S6_00386g1_1 n=1 Tax=Dekkera bruxellensis TaxID=5007 RepID=A0A7D9D2W6_DEKBR|nr:DEBR0S6_00386g1_1 [Brettanomyces bruxellensis]